MESPALSGHGDESPRSDVRCRMSVRIAGISQRGIPPAKVVWVGRREFTTEQAGGGAMHSGRRTQDGDTKWPNIN